MAPGELHPATDLQPDRLDKQKGTWAGSLDWSWLLNKHWARDRRLQQSTFPDYHVRLNAPPLNSVPAKTTCTADFSEKLVHIDLPAPLQEMAIPTCLWHPPGLSSQ